MEKEIYTLQIDESLEKVMPPLSELELGLLTQSLLAEDAVTHWSPGTAKSWMVITDIGFVRRMRSPSLT